MKTDKKNWYSPESEYMTYLPLPILKSLLNITSDVSSLADDSIPSRYLLFQILVLDGFHCV